MIPKAFLCAALLGVAAGAAVPRAFSVPSNKGFPTPNSQQVLGIERQAGGRLSNSPLPSFIGAGTTTAFQLIAFNELFEVAYFTSLIKNITNGEYEAPPGVLDALRAVQAQEELHALAAISTLEAAGKFAPKPCKYTFPTNKFEDAIALAETFTAVVLGALQDANVLFTNDRAPGFIRIVSSVIGQEGEQSGFYRSVLERIPSESPFLTTVPGAFAFSALQAFVVPNSCPFPLSMIDLPILPPLITNGDAAAVVGPRDQTLSFEADLSTSMAARRYAGGDGRGLYLTYTTGQQVPFPVEVNNVRWRGGTIFFQAGFPYKEHVMGGFSHGALTTNNEFTGADDVVKSALAGPAIIQVNSRI